MGSIYRHQSVRWTDDRGTRVAKGTPGARRQVQKSKRWWGKYRDADGAERRVPLSTDNQVARQMLADFERSAARRSVGIEDRHTDHATTPVGRHIDDWLQALMDAGASDRRRPDLGRRVRALGRLGGWRAL